MSTIKEQGALGRAFLKEIDLRLFEEAVPRLQKCLRVIDEGLLWRRPNDETVSAGNLVLHLNGNVTQWVLSALGGKADRRVRQQEFDEKGPVPRAQLQEKLRTTMAEARDVVRKLDPARLLEPVEVQGFDETALGILVHVTEHFSYHVGQVSYIVKSNQEIDLGYYADQDLDETGA
jgi:hypothetical protein